MPMQNFGGTTKSIMVFLKKAYLRNSFHLGNLPISHWGWAQKLFLFPTSLLTDARKYLRVKFMLLSYRALIKNHEVTVEIVDHLTKTGEWTEAKPPGKMFGSIYGDLRIKMF